MDIFNNIFSFFTDHNNKPYLKISVGFGILFFLLLADNLIGFTYYHNTQRKIEQTKLISEITRDTTLPVKTRDKLTAIQLDLLDRESLITRVIKQVKLEQWHYPDTVYVNNKGKVIQRYYSKDNKNQNWHILSSGGIFLLFGFFMTFTVIKNSNSEHLSMISGSGWIFLIWIFVIASCAFFSFFLSFIPQVGDSWIYNYILNFLIQIISIVLVVLLMIWQDKRISSGHYDERNRKRYEARVKKYTVTPGTEAESKNPDSQNDKG